MPCAASEIVVRNRKSPSFASVRPGDVDAGEIWTDLAGAGHRLRHLERDAAGQRADYRADMLDVDQALSLGHADLR